MKHLLKLIHRLNLFSIQNVFIATVFEWFYPEPDWVFVGGIAFRKSLDRTLISVFNARYKCNRIEFAK